MHSKYPILKPAEIISALEKAGFYYVSQKGSHAKYRKDSHTVIIPMHNEIAKGTLKSILSQSRLTLEEFVDLL